MRATLPFPLLCAGYDLSTEDGYETMKKDFGEMVGFKYLVAMHLNDSKGKVEQHQILRR